MKNCTLTTKYTHRWLLCLIPSLVLGALPSEINAKTTRLDEPQEHSTYQPKRSSLSRIIGDNLRRLYSGKVIKLGKKSYGDIVLDGESHAFHDDGIYSVFQSNYRNSQHTSGKWTIKSNQICIEFEPNHQAYKNDCFSVYSSKDGEMYQYNDQYHFVQIINISPTPK